MGASSEHSGMDGNSPAPTEPQSDPQNRCRIADSQSISLTLSPALISQSTRTEVPPGNNTVVFGCGCGAGGGVGKSGRQSCNCLRHYQPNQGTGSVSLATHPSAFPPPQKKKKRKLHEETAFETLAILPIMFDKAEDQIKSMQKPCLCGFPSH